MRPRHIAIALLFLLSGLYASCQSAAESFRVYGEFDSDIPLPGRTAHHGIDASAIQALTAFKQVTHLSEWEGMTGTGTIVIAGDPTPHTARLAILGGNSYRLDIDKDGATVSTVVSNGAGAYVQPGAAPVQISPDAISGGLLVLPRFLTSGYPLATSTISDGNNAIITGTALHRITLDDLSIPDDGAAMRNPVDLYFDPATNYLRLTASYVHLTPMDSSLYLLVTSYDDYREAGETVFPMTISQRINGSPLWSLTLSSLSLNAPTDQSLFSF